MLYGDLRVDGVTINEDNRQTVFVLPDDRPGRGDLERWRKHFARGGIHSVIHLSGAGYALYREGRDATFDATDESYGNS